ncbi:MAG TPA: polysaccharide deacetylase family protein [Syntrophorhabdus sp.]|nr:polysaccharide deacetylase family protein [Syntrophorhabdus sp.]
MTIKVYITIDTEEDQWGNYVASEATVHNVKKISMLQQLFDRYGAIPTYLVNYPVVMNEDARSIIKGIYDDGRCGIGMHCHPWNTPPIREELSNYNSMLCNLPDDLVYEKLRSLHQVLVDHWGVAPVCFRAGRWGFGENVARSIHELGYKIDTSITPFTDWAEYDGPDFSDALIGQYRFNPEAILTVNPRGDLLEVPPTVGFLQTGFKRCAWLRKKIAKGRFSKFRLLGILEKLGLLNLRWLSPELCSGSEMVRLSNSLLENGCRHLNMSFHSTSIAPGLSPFVRTENDLIRFLYDIELFLQFAHGKGFESVSIDKALDA